MRSRTRDPRPGRFALAVWALLFLSLGFCPLSADAHDPPRDYYDRNITVRLQADGARVLYRLEISQVTLYGLPQIDRQIRLTGVKDKKSYAAACLERFKVLVPDRLLGELNGRALRWEVENTRIEDQGSVHFLLFLRANWQLADGDNHFEITDTNFLDKTDPFKLKIDADDGLLLTELNEPRERAKPSLDDVDRQRASAVFHLEFSAESTRIEAAPLPELSIWERLRRDDLAALLSTNYAFWLIILVALIHGAGHSLMPGHGKTMVASYLVGERGTPWHAVLLGIVTTLTHTSAAIAVALLLRYVLPQNSQRQVNMLLMFISGLLMACIGLWLFLQRLSGRSDHVHLFDVSHSHSHGEAPASLGRAGFIRLVLLGIAGGIIPCWGAIMWVIGCIATSQFWLALPVVLAFSVGLASVLVLIGLSVVYGGRVGKSRWGERRWFRRLFNERTVRWMPVVGAAIVVVIGLTMAALSGIAD